MSSALDEDMTRLKNGDREAFAPVFKTLWPTMHAFCERALGSGSDADDAAQAALEKMFSRAHDYDVSRPALPWALAFAAWECRTLRKKRIRFKEDALPEHDVFAASGDPEQDAIGQDLKHALQSVLETLSPVDRATLEIAFVDDVNQQVSMEKSTFRKRKERALRRLRDLFRSLYDH